MKGGKMQRVDGADSKLLSLRARVVQKKLAYLHKE